MPVEHSQSSDIHCTTMYGNISLLYFNTFIPNSQELNAKASLYQLVPALYCEHFSTS